jgi:putative acetyltransferase
VCTCSTLRIRPESAGDAAEIRRVVTAAFGRADEADLVEGIRSSPEYEPDLALVAELDGDLVGHVMISRALLRTRRADRSIVMLSPLSVAPAVQRQGIGGALVQGAVEGAARADEPLVVLEGSPAYYGRFGFEPALRRGIELPLPSWAPPEAGQVIVLRPEGDELSGTVVYPPSFDSIDE